MATISEVNSKVESLTQSLESKLNVLIEGIGNLTVAIVDLKQPKVEVKPAVEPAKLPVTDSQTYPVPKDYRTAVDEVLNKAFGIQIEPHTDSPSFMFTIVVPDKYSSLSPSQKEMQKVDLRPKVISYAEGLNGVKLWAERVYNNFSPDVRAQITADR